MIEYNEDITQIEVSNKYSLENKLLSAAIHLFLKPYLFKTDLDATQVLMMQTELTTLLFANFKYKFTVIEVKLENEKLIGGIRYENGLPLDFELKYTKQA